MYEKLDNTEVKLHPDIDGIIEAIKLKDVALVASRMGNVLESVTVPLYPVIDSIKKDITATKEMEKTRHKIVYDFTSRLEAFSLNTVVSGFKEYTNKLIAFA